MVLFISMDLQNLSKPLKNTTKCLFERSCLVENMNLAKNRLYY